MPKISDTVFDQKLNYIKNNVDKIVVLDADPGVGTGQAYTDANTNNGTSTGKKIAEVTVDSSDFTVQDATLGTGREVVSGAQSSVAAVAAGDATHIAFLDTSNTEVLLVTELSTTRSGIVVSDPLDIPAIIYDSPDAEVAS